MHDRAMPGSSITVSLRAQTCVFAIHHVETCPRVSRARGEAAPFDLVDGLALGVQPEHESKFRTALLELGFGLPAE